MTGRYQQRFGHEFNPVGAIGLPLTETTIANRLKAAGYVTGLVGKWHLGSKPELHPQKRGFDEFFGFLGGAHSYFDAAAILRGEQQVKEMDYTTDAFGREAAAFIEKHKARPWFLYLAFNAVHTPMHATNDRLAKFAGIADKQRRTYDAMMLAMDDAVGRVRKKLADANLDQNTLIVFISDNGGPTMTGVTVNGSRNDPLRGSKRTTLEGGIRVPFLISWPGHVKAGVYDQPVIQLDLTATALTLGGAKTDKLEGVNLLPFLSGEESGAPHAALYWRFGQQMAIRAGDYKLVRYDSNADTQTGGKKQPVTAAKLYNLVADIGESKDLAAAQPDKVKELQCEMGCMEQVERRPALGQQRQSRQRRPRSALPRRSQKRKRRNSDYPPPVH